MRTSRRRSLSSWVSPTIELSRARRLKFGGYDAWYDTKQLERPLYDTRKCSNGMCEFVNRGGSRRTTAKFWVEYYRPLHFTSFGKHFASGMNSILKLPGYVL